MDPNQAQPGSRESSSGGEGGTQVEVQDVLNTRTTGKPPENVNTVPDDSAAESDAKAQPGSRESSSGGEGGTQVEVQDVLNTNTTGKSPENANQ